MSDAELADDIEGALRDPAILAYNKKATGKYTYPLNLIWFGYTFVFCAVEPLIQPGWIRDYVSFFVPLSDFCSLFVSAVRAHPRDLIDHGYEYRALIVAHIYSFNWLIFVISLGHNIFYRAFYRAHSAKLPSAYAGVIRPHTRWTTIRIFVLFSVLIMFFYIGPSNLITVDWRLKHSWPVQFSNLPLVSLPLILWAADYTISQLYTFLLILRVAHLCRVAHRKFLTI